MKSFLEVNEDYVRVMAYPRDWHTDDDAFMEW
jgi:hypothetical protein